MKHCENKSDDKRLVSASVLVILFSFVLTGCVTRVAQTTPAPQVPHEERWGIYSLDLATQEVEILFSSPNELTTLRLNPAGDRLAFSQKIGGDANEDQEIFTMGIDDRTPQRLTDNQLWDIYPAWSPDGTRIAFLTWRSSSLGIYVMDADGDQVDELYDSEFHDSDIHWAGDLIAFTRNSQIWIMDDDGSDAHQLTQPPRAEEWGNANLPFGDYDPRISPDGLQIVFERMVEDQSSHGNYDLYKIDVDGSNLIRLTETGYSQGLASWSHAGDQIVYIVAAQDDVGKFDIYIMNADGTENENITPAYFPPDFLCHWAIFSKEDTKLFFIGEWWSQE